MDSKKDKKHRAGEAPQPDTEMRDGIEVHCIGLENIPVTNAELDVLETYAGDLIRMFVKEHMNGKKANKKKE
ncbi:MAG: hypothetical protein GKR97_00490 [Rhizobiaceae bacterium]|nr:hypothetical protein [Rhizobiaceae bacterium]